jgi:hypothetical protein
MNTREKNEIRELGDEELSAVQGGLSCANGAHISDAKITVRSQTDWVALARSYLGL